MQCLILYALALKTSTREMLASMYNYSGKYIYANSGITARNYQICEKLANDLISGSIKICVLLAIAIDLSICAPLNKLTFKHEKELIIPVILPFINPDTDFGFYMNLGNQLVICLYGAIIIPGKAIE